MCRGGQGRTQNDVAKRKKVTAVDTYSIYVVRATASASLLIHIAYCGIVRSLLPTPNIQ